jgi:hypothetical protein
MRKPQTKWRYLPREANFFCVIFGRWGNLAGAIDIKQRLEWHTDCDLLSVPNEFIPRMALSICGMEVL